MLKKLAFISVIAANAMAMHSIELNINDADVEVGATLDLGQFNYSLTPNTTFLGVKYLKTDKDNSDFSDPKTYIEANFLVQKEVESGFYAGLGIKLNYIDLNDVWLSRFNQGNSTDFTSIPLTLKGGYNIKAMFPISLSAQIDYAPQVLTFQDGKNYMAYHLEAEAQVVENASAYIGYRDMQVEYDIPNTSSASLNKSFYIGVKFKF